MLYRHPNLPRTSLDVIRARVNAALRNEIATAASREGISVSEFTRRAVCARLQTGYNQDHAT